MQDANGSLSVVVPCWNEEENIRPTVEGLIRVLSKDISDFEILIVNDGSTDKTLEQSKILETEYPQVRSINNDRNRGLGYTYGHGVRKATKDFIVMCPGDNENPPESILELCEYRGKADIIVPYPVNTEVRSFFRRFVSNAFVATLNFVTKRKLKYYNGTVLHKRSVIQKVQIETNGFAYQAEILAKLFLMGHDFFEFPVKIVEAGSKSRAFQARNLISVSRAILRLHLLGLQSRYLKKNIKPLSN